MWIASLLPLTFVTAAPMDQPTLEDHLASALRAAVVAGWTPVDSGGDEHAVSVTLASNGLAETMIADVDAGTFRIVPAVVPANGYVDDNLAAMLNDASFGLTIDGDCGTHWVEPYVIEAHATGRAAQKLVARTLGSADDVESAGIVDGEADFNLDRGGTPIFLRVTLDEHGIVTAAEVERDDVLLDTTTYARMHELERAVAGRRVTAMDTDDGEAPVLVIGSRHFAIDPDSDAFVDNPRDPDDTGCGC